MLKTSIIIIVTYVIMQFSSILGLPLLFKLLPKDGLSKEELINQAIGYWGVISFIIALIVIIFIVQRNKETMEMRGSKPPLSTAVGWAIGGPFIALIAQALAASIENLIGIEMGSQNTADLLEIAKVAPIFILVISILAPAIEEIVFRKVIFGGLYTKFNFIISALISSVIFAVVHGEPQHILIYASMGFTFAFLYVKTKRLLVPIFAHVAMNSYVVAVQLLFADDIQKLQEQTFVIFPFL